MRKVPIFAAALMLSLLFAGCTDNNATTTQTPSRTPSPAVTDSPTPSVTDDGLDEIIPDVDDGRVEDDDGIIDDENASPTPSDGILNPDSGSDVRPSGE